ncbi:MAG: lysine transporter LysE [Micrococcales bacterium 70-64]|nr:LysE family translocator [Leifsonia sp.]ODU65073.1 MAG: lysine transporter LysE [Leifsonia sp. SCN 70-46]OJX86765.1 MAG: lysine transporter LysE [Micrococcales bacterium 70-64]
MTVASALWSFALLAGVLTIIPGPDSALILRSALVQTRRHAYATALGIASGTFVWGAAAAVGAAALLAASEVAFTILKVVGALYLAYLGISMIVKSFRRAHAEAAVAAPVGTLKGAFARGALTNLLNPKVGVFYIALIPQFIPPGVPPVGMGLLLAGVHVVESIVWFTGLILAAHFARAFLSSPRVSAWIDRVTGGILVAFGVFLAVESRQTP